MARDKKLNKDKKKSLSLNQKEKSKFRKTAAWKKFRAFMKKKAEGRDELTGSKLYPGWQLHHLDMSPENYQDLNPENFVCLNKKSHEFIHFLFRYEYDTILGRARKILTKMEELNVKQGKENEKKP